MFNFIFLNDKIIKVYLIIKEFYKLFDSIAKKKDLQTKKIPYFFSVIKLICAIFQSYLRHYKIR